MNIKRYFAPNIRQAIRQVREEQGPDAVILSNQQVNGGVEIVAAVDFDETMFRSVVPAPAAKRSERKAAAPVQQYTREVQPGTSEKHTVTENIWSQEPTLVEMRGELQYLRNILENQLSGLAWGDLVRKHPQRAELLQRLMKIGLSAALCNEIATEITVDSPIEQAWQHSQEILAEKIIIPQDDILDRGGIIALVGPTGVGKTTTAAKLAARYALRYGHRHVALITIDNYRVGAHEQLRTYGRILDVPVRVADNPQELHQILDDLYDRSLVIIDTAGMGQHDSKLLQQKGILDNEAHKIKKFLLLPATTRASGLEDIIQAFTTFGLDGCIFSKLDESTSLGGLLSAVVKHRLPVGFSCDGQRVPEDIHPARREMLVSQCIEVMLRAGNKVDEDLVSLNLGKEVVNA